MGQQFPELTVVLGAVEVVEAQGVFTARVRGASGAVEGGEAHSAVGSAPFGHATVLDDAALSQGGLTGNDKAVGILMLLCPVVDQLRCQIEGTIRLGIGSGFALW